MLENVQIVNYKKVEEDEQPDAHLPKIYYHTLFVPEVVEYAPGRNIPQKIMRAMNRSQIYIGIFGNQYSQPTVDEYHDASKRGMSILAYYFTQPPTVLKDKPISDQVRTFLMEQVKTRDLLIGGNYNRISIKTQSDLENQIVADLSAEVMEMIRKYQNVQKAIEGYET